jgi:hypothetical protein
MIDTATIPNPQNPLASDVLEHLSPGGTRRGIVECGAQACLSQHFSSTRPRRPNALKTDGEGTRLSAHRRYSDRRDATGVPQFRLERPA